MPNLEKLQQWLLYTPHGQYTLLNERKFYQNAVNNVFGYHSLQIGLPEINFLQGNKINSRFILGKDIKSHLAYLPFENNSIDLIVCPHALEYTPNYEQVLNEFQRVLISRGKLILTVFNCSSFFSYQAKKNNYLKDMEAIKLSTIKQQLYNSNLNIQGGKFLGYCPIFDTEKTISRLDFLDKIGDRWFPTFANVFGLVATKDVIRHIPLNNSPSSYEHKLSPVLGTA